MTTRLTALIVAALSILIAIPAMTTYQRSTVDPLIASAADHIARGEWDAAITASTAAIQRDPFRSLAYVYRGIAYDQLGNQPIALGEFDRAWSLNPRSPEMFNAKGWLYYRQGYLTAAIDHYNIAIYLDPTAPQYYYNLALALDDYGYPAGAALNYQRFLDRYTADDEYSRHALERIKALGG
jgi:tetratricopeptide (TPR) repeat protein